MTHQVATTSADRGTASDAVLFDTPFFTSQTFGDIALQRELLALFVDQVRDRVAALPILDEAGQNDVAHLLKGSSRGIGAGLIAAAAEQLEVCPAAERPAAMDELRRAVFSTVAAIERFGATLAD